MPQSDGRLCATRLHRCNHERGAPMLHGAPLVVLRIAVQDEANERNVAVHLVLAARHRLAAQQRRRRVNPQTQSPASQRGTRLFSTA